MLPLQHFHSSVCLCVAGKISRWTLSQEKKKKNTISASLEVGWISFQLQLYMN